MLPLEQLIISRAHRALRHIANYRRISEAQELPGYASCVEFQQNEKLVGLYENLPNHANESVMITTLGLHISQESAWKFVSYEQLERAEVPITESKSTVEELKVHLKSGKVIGIPIRGGDDKFRDAWSFLRFLDRVIGDIQLHRGQR